MNSILMKAGLMKRCMITIHLLAMCSVLNIYAINREISVSLHGNTDGNIAVMIDQCDRDSIMVEKDKTYTLRVSDKVNLNLFYTGEHKSGSRGFSLAYPVKPSTISLVLKPTVHDAGLGLEVEQEAGPLQTFLSSLASFVATLLIE